MTPAELLEEAGAGDAFAGAGLAVVAAGAAGVPMQLVFHSEVIGDGAILQLTIVPLDTEPAVIN